MEEILINGRKIGKSQHPYVIAELSANHNGSLERALQTIEMIARCGADAVKLQTYTADTMTIDCDRDDFQIKGGLWDGYKLYDLYKWAQTPYEWHEEMFAKAKELGITIFSTPFDKSAVDLLESLNTPVYKIASFEVTDLPLIERVGSTRKPMIISTGMADLQEIKEAVKAARDAGCSELVLLHCISGYPTPVDQANLSTIRDLEERFGCIVGLSDHTLGSMVSVAAIALGACVIEKHVTLDRNEKGPDSEFSMEPAELESLCRDVKSIWKAVGTPGYERKPVEIENMKFRRSIYFVETLKKGEIISESSIRIIRPGYGLAPKFYNKLIGKRVNSDVIKGTATSWRIIDE